jgi:hypothetical protein
LSTIKRISKNKTRQTSNKQTNHLSQQVEPCAIDSTTPKQIDRRVFHQHCVASRKQLIAPFKKQQSNTIEKKAILFTNLRVA